RIENNGGAGGAAARNSWTNGTLGVLGSGIGFGIAAGGTTDVNAPSYVVPIDSGTMTLFRSTGAANPYSLTKSGVGTLTLTSATPLTGGISVLGGTLVLAGSAAAPGSTSLTVAAGATLILDNTATNVANRISDTAPVTLSGGTLIFKG